MIVPIYRPRITIYERMEDGRWELKYDPVTLTTWEAMPDEDTVRELPRPDRDLRKVVAGGSEPAHVLEVPGGAWMTGKDGKTYLKTAEKPALDPLEALTRARRGAGDVALVSSAPEMPPPAPMPRPAIVPEPDPFAGVPACAGLEAAAFETARAMAEAPRRGRGKAAKAEKQPSLFGDDL